MSKKRESVREGQPRTASLCEKHNLQKDHELNLNPKSRRVVKTRRFNRQKESLHVQKADLLQSKIVTRTKSTATGLKRVLVMYSSKLNIL